MNIVLVAPWRLEAVGGVSIAVATLYRRFQERDHRVRALICGESNLMRKVGSSAGEVVYGIYLRTPHDARARVRTLVTFWLFLPLTLLQLQWFLFRNRVDVVHIQYPLPCFFYFGLLRRISRWRLVVTYQGNDAHDLKEWSTGEQRLVRLLLGAADQITGVSRSLLEKVRQVLGQPYPQAVAVPNGAPLEDIQRNVAPPSVHVPAKYIVAVGHLIRRKGIDTLLQALSKALERGHVVPLVLVGDGPERGLFENLTRDLGLSAHVHFVGSRPHSETIALIRASTFFVLASREEGLPLVVAEAMACRKAVVGTAIDGVPEIVTDGETGLLVPAEDPEALCAAVLRLWDDDDLRERLAGNAYARSKSFSWESIAERYLRLYSGASS
jgi:L-malate glycosyltransferase